MIEQSYPAIECAGLGRRYTAEDNAKTALHALDLRVERGTVHGLLGPNGAGKTTLVRILATLLLPSEGTAAVAGYDVVKETREVRQRIGLVLGGDKGFYGRLSARDNLQYFAALHGYRPTGARTRVEELGEMVGLSGELDTPVTNYSRGMRQRLHLARGLFTSPEVLLLDEPTIGVDAEGAQQIRRLIPRLTANGCCVLLTSHYMQEVDDLCSNITVIANGHTIARGTPDALKANVGQVYIQDWTVPGPLSAAIHEAIENDRTVIRLETHDRHSHSSVRVHAWSNDEFEALAQVDGATLEYHGTRAPSMEEAYLRITRAANE